MALKAIVESLEGLSEDVAAEYSQREDGKFQLQVDAIGGLELADTAGLKSALQKERQSVADLKGEVKKYGDLDPDAAREALTKVEQLGEMTPTEKVEQQIRTRTEKLVAQHNADKATLEKTIDGLKGQLSANLIDVAATAALNELGGNVRLLLPHVRGMTRMRQTDDGRFVAEVLDENGQVEIDGQGNPLTIPKLVEKMKSDDTFAPAFKGSGATGSGAGGSGGNTGGTGGGGNAKSVSLTDQGALNANIDKIASGEVTVTE